VAGAGRWDIISTSTARIFWALGMKVVASSAPFSTNPAANNHDEQSKVPLLLTFEISRYQMKQSDGLLPFPSLRHQDLQGPLQLHIASPYLRRTLEKTKIRANNIHIDTPYFLHIFVMVTKHQ